MSNKILAAIQEDHEALDSYLNYTARLARDFNLGLELVSGVEEYTNNPEPVAILGEGLPLPIKLSQEIVAKERRVLVKNKVEELKGLGNNLLCDISMVPVRDRLLDEDAVRNVRFVTFNRKSRNNYFSQLFGVVDIDLSKKYRTPSLTIPEGYEYEKPKTILALFDDLSSVDVHQLHLLSKTMNLDMKFVFHEKISKESIDQFMLNNQVKYGDFMRANNSVILNEAENLDKIIVEQKPDWLAIANFDSTFLERFYDRSSDEVLFASKFPIINY